jgi:hypothetical protein
MTIHTLAPLPQQQAPDTSAASTAYDSTAYDSVWAGSEDAPGASTQEQTPQQQSALEETMLSHDKLYVVLAVVLLVWLGVALLLFRTDRRLARLERDDTK